MIHIPLFDNPPDDVWLQKAESLTEKLKQEPDIGKRKKIIDDNASVWREIKKHLQKLSHNKCWYSESREVYSHYHVEHFRPKKKALDLGKEDQGGYWWLAFDWKNYRICGSVGNTKKGDRFFVKKNKATCPTDDLDDEVICFLDPIDEDDVLKITFNENGEMVPLENDKKAWDCERAQYTIRHLDLNFELLKEARRELWDDIDKRIAELQNLMKKNNQTPSASRKATIRQKMKDLRDYLKPSSQFSATAKACLLKSGINWAMRMA